MYLPSLTAAVQINHIFQRSLTWLTIVLYCCCMHYHILSFILSFLSIKLYIIFLSVFSYVSLLLLSLLLLLLFHLLHLPLSLSRLNISVINDVIVLSKIVKTSFPNKKSLFFLSLKLYKSDTFTYETNIIFAFVILRCFKSKYHGHQ